MITTTEHASLRKVSTPPLAKTLKERPFALLPL